MARPFVKRVLRVSASDGSHELTTVDDPEIIGPIDFAWKLGDGGHEHTTFGAGPIAGSFVPGANRLVVCGRSPIWDTFYPSTIGGAGLPWQAIGASFLQLSGRAAAPSLLIVARVRGRLVAEVAPFDPHAAWRGHGGEIGLHALMRRAHEACRDRFTVGRVLAVGPAAARVRSGAIGSAPLRRGELTSVDTWAGRGGLGSRLYQHHGICAVVFGGDRADDVVQIAGDADDAGHAFDAGGGSGAADRRWADRLSGERLGRPLELAALERTSKYRFDPKFKTGGTFGSNFHTLRERALSFNYRSVLFPDETRVRIHERLIAGHYLRQFDQEIAARHQEKSATCGEPCGVACKKVDGKLKKDYEPYQSMGPLIGVFDQRAAERIVRFADACGFDAIQVGGDIAWVMECLDRGWLAPEELGVKEGPRWDPDAIEPAVDSAHNAELGRRVIEWILDGASAAPLREGLRTGARAAGGAAAQVAVYNANGDGHACMVPNQYWVPGMFAPVPIMGRYYLDYDYEWKPPRELGRSCAARMVKELMLDNYGMCRFHRGWAETLLPELVNTFLGAPVDAERHHRRLALAMHGQNRAQPWETERVIDLVHGYLVKYRADGPREPELDPWLSRFAADKRAAARAYWEEMRAGFDDGLRAPS
jgi:glyceraldehyde-3-phosphate dehydrogenase (ferredoxin)